MSAEKPNAERLQLTAEMVSAAMRDCGHIESQMERVFLIRDHLNRVLQSVPSEPRTISNVQLSTTERGSFDSAATASAVGQPSLEKLRELEASKRKWAEHIARVCTAESNQFRAGDIIAFCDELRAVLAEFEKEGK